jgi:predicted dehydrogenase
MTTGDATAGSGYGLSGVAQRGTTPAPKLDYLPPRPRSYRPKIALIGCGGISEYHLRAYRAMGFDVVALCNRDRAKAERRREEFFPAASVASDFRVVLQRDDIEVVDVALPPGPRVNVIEAALRARKHVLSQKPFVDDLDTGERLVRLAEENGVRLAVNQNGRWAPHFSYLAAAIAGGVIGEVASIDFTLQWDHTWTAGTPFENIHHLVLLDFGIHWFDAAARFMAGQRPTQVAANVARASFQHMKPPMLAEVAIDYPGAQVRLAFNGLVKHGQEDRTVIAGSRGTLRSFGPSLSDQRVTVHTAAGDASPDLEGTWFTNGFAGAMSELLCAIEERREPSHSARNNLATLELCFAAIASADAGGKPMVPGAVSRIETGDL